MKKPLYEIDFETEAIEDRPNYPPKPVGVAIIEPGTKPYYMAWGHPTNNNCTFKEGKQVVTDIYKKGVIGGHNLKFDMEVAERWFDLPILRYEGFEDSMLTAFLNNPYEYNFKLKDLCKTHLGIDPKEQDALYKWIKANVPEAAQKTNLGEFIAKAPGDLVGRYACKDVVMSSRLRKKHLRSITQRGMLDAYNVEKEIVKDVIIMERTGIRLATRRLDTDLKAAETEHNRLHKSIIRKLGDINIDSGVQKANAMEAKGLVTDWEYTEKDNRKTGRESLARVCSDKKLVTDLDRFDRFSKIIRTYMKPWLESAKNNNNRFFPWFNQIRGDNDKGAKTGRFSSNFQQVPRSIKDIAYNDLPFMRNYVLPDSKYHVLMARDFKQQEVRILADYEQGDLFNAYELDPLLDAHDLVKQLMEARTHKEYERIKVKTCNFLIVYGGGGPAMVNQLGIMLDEAYSILKAHGKALPGVKDLKSKIQKHAKRGEPIYTAGGREYFADLGFEYRLMNYLIQGGAADHTKRSMIRINRAFAKLEDTRIMVPIHDEFLTSGPKKDLKRNMHVFRSAMDDDALFEVPMLSDGKAGTCWGKLKEYKD